MFVHIGSCVNQLCVLSAMCFDSIAMCARFRMLLFDFGLNRRSCACAPHPFVLVEQPERTPNKSISQFNFPFDFYYFPRRPTTPFGVTCKRKPENAHAHSHRNTQCVNSIRNREMAVFSPVGVYVVIVLFVCLSGTPDRVHVRMQGRHTPHLSIIYSCEIRFCVRGRKTHTIYGSRCATRYVRIIIRQHARCCPT